LDLILLYYYRDASARIMKKILIVEDETIVALDLKSRLTSMEYEVVGTVAKGEDAVSLALESAPHCVLMDVQLKGDMDGIEAAGRIREELDIPIIFITAYGDKKTIERAKVQDAFGYILKPYNDREIYTNIEIAIYKHGIEKKLKESEKRLEITLRSIAEGVIATDSQGVITYVNPAGLTLLERKENEVLHKPLEDVFTCKLREEVTAKAELPSTGQSGYYPSLVFLQKKDHSLVPIERTESEIKDDLGNPQGRVIAFRDMLERELYEEQLRQAKKEAEQANRAKTELFAGMSHELRTPLNNIIGMADVGMGNSGIEEDLLETFRLIKQGGENLLAVVNSILDFTGLKDGTSHLEERVFSLRDLLEKEFEKISLRGYRKGLDMYFYYHPSVPERIKGDDRKIRKVLHQLLENAIKFTEKGYVLVEVFLHEQKVLVLKVQDTGVGMSRDIQEIIFNEFTQGSDLYTRSFGGIGIGLSLVKEFMKVLGGNVLFESSPQGGTSFTCRVPFNHAPAIARESGKKISDVSSILGNRKVLLHCSDSIEKEILEALFVKEGCPDRIVSGGAGEQQAEREDQEGPLHLFCSVNEYVKTGGLENAFVLSTPYRNETIPEDLVQPRAIGNKPILSKTFLPLLKLFCDNNSFLQEKNDGNEISTFKKEVKKEKELSACGDVVDENTIIEELCEFQNNWEENWNYDKNEEFAAIASAMRNKVLKLGWEDCAKDLLKTVFALRSGKAEKIKEAKELLSASIQKYVKKQ
jgi:PAS domain S-box-containing protein